MSEDRPKRPIPVPSAERRAELARMPILTSLPEPTAEEIAAMEAFHGLQPGESIWPPGSAERWRIPDDDPNPYRAVLVRYMAHVLRCEGRAYLPIEDPAGDDWPRELRGGATDLIVLRGIAHDARRLLRGLYPENVHGTTPITDYYDDAGDFEWAITELKGPTDG